MKHLILLQTSFFAHVKEGRHDLLGSSLSEFKETTTAMCYAPDVIWHDVHFSLSYVQEELQLLLETVATEISKFIQRAISFLSRMIEHVRLMITHPPLPTKKDNTALRALAVSGKITKADIVQLGRAIHAAAYSSTGVTIYEVISGLAALFGMEISEAYANTCYADMKYRCKKSYTDFIDNLRDTFLERIERDLDKKKKKELTTA